MPNAKHTCEAIRNLTSSTHENERIILDYSDLAYAANKAGLLTINSQNDLNSMTRALQKYHQDHLDGSINYMKVKCLSLELQDKLLHDSLKYDRMLSHHAPSDDPFFGEEALKKDFEQESSTSLCALDVEATLSMIEWQNFFNSCQSSN